ncbi:MAG: carbohydrate binding family 9 domain-containing protein [Candidatus Marinimicrobia bacterium]|nr:carbohydrate binding family 9 domain-containing protein [Candidatus Neomarinimicrobiota bacterium]MCF7850830.1 carbohydrate binding family 9 domain-containing protein [Candidatus Neomarinimicrobiota bacterium]MCF7904750.1 carbohydrate binding family 9 domain-containing protein [Candidatus Neomarinimicrobiota bacterium]
MKNPETLIILIIFSLPGLLFGRADGKAVREERIAEACQLNGTGIRIDGNLDDYVWEKAPRFGDFKQRNPEDGAAPSQDTEFAVCYDNEHLYVAVRAYDSDPSQITGILTRRDESSPSDWVYISIDSYNDNRTAFEFGLNAAGVKQDLRRYDDTNADFDWGAVWEGAVNIDAEGWTAEFAIPFRELRFNTGAEPIWGLNVYRELPRNDNELAIWNYWSHEQSGFVSNYGDLTGLSGLETKQPIYVSPYIMGQSGANDALLKEVNEYESLTNIGADIRKNFENGLTFSGTINPDFGQVEADPAEFNLTEFESFFREKRGFFIEGGNIFNFSLGFGDGDQSANTLFYSRRIGRSPQGYQDYKSDATAISVDKPDHTRILGAGKFTGKLNNGLSLGLMTAATPEERAVVLYDDGSTSENVIEPATSYVLTRVQQDFREGLTTLGGIFTSTQRSLDNTGMDWLREKAYTTGIDFNHNFHDRTYLIQSALAYSYVSGSQDAILGTQLHPSRYFQRPDATHLSVDSTATSLSGYAGKFILGKTSGRFNAFGGVLATSPGFEVNDLGFMRSVDNINEFLWLSYRNMNANEYLQNYRINVNQWANWTFGGERKSLGGNVNGHVTFLNSWSAGGGINRNIGGMTPYHLRGGPGVQGPDNLGIWSYLNSDYRKALSVNLFANYFQNDDGVKAISLSPGVNWRPKKNISLSLAPDFNLFEDTWAWVTSMEDDEGSPHYIFSGMDQIATSLTFRADVILSTTLSVQYYTQAFLTGGDYYNFIEVADPTQKDFNKRFTPLDDNTLEFESYGALSGVDFDQDGMLDYWPTGGVDSDFNYQQLTSNLVLRWEYSVGSVMYVVWSRGASFYDVFEWGSNGLDSDPVQDLRHAMGLDADNMFLLKINKLLNL